MSKEQIIDDIFQPSNIQLLTGGYNNPVFLIQLANGIKRVIKFTKPNSIEFEFLLNADRKELPKVFNKFHEENEVFFEMEYIEGVRLYEILKGIDENSYKSVERSIKQISSFLIKMSLWQPAISLNLKKAHPLELNKKAFEYLTKDELSTLINYIDLAEQTIELGITHGDFTTKNIIHSLDGIHVFDWESVRIDSVYRDISTFIWYCSLHHPQIFNQIWETIRNQYMIRNSMELDKNLIVANAIKHIAGVINHSFSKDSDTYDTWKKRILIAFRWSKLFLS